MRRRHIVFALCAIFLGGCNAATAGFAAAPSATASQSGTAARARGRPIFEERFAGTSLDHSFWDPFVTDNAANGWPWSTQKGEPPESSAVDRPNAFNADYDLPSEVSVDGGLLLGAHRGTTAKGYSWTGSVVTTYPDTHFGRTRGVTFGDAYVEVRAKLPYAGAGSWPAIWLLPAPGSSGAEIDLHEGGYLDGGIDPDRIFACNVHSSGNVQKVVDTGERLSAAYHTYALAYHQGVAVQMFLDDKLMCDYTHGVPTGRYFLLIVNTVASSKTAAWHSHVSGSSPNPNVMRVAWVRMYAL